MKRQNIEIVRLLQLIIFVEKIVNVILIKKQSI